MPSEASIQFKVCPGKSNNAGHYPIMTHLPAGRMNRDFVTLRMRASRSAEWSNSSCRIHPAHISFHRGGIFQLFDFQKFLAADGLFQSTCICSHGASPKW